MSTQKILEEIRELKSRIATLEQIIAPPNPFDLFDTPSAPPQIKKKRPTICSYVWEEHHITTEGEPVTYTFKVTSCGNYYINDKDLDTMTCKEIMNSKAMLNKLTMPTKSSALTKAIALESVKKLMDKKSQGQI